MNRRICLNRSVLDFMDSKITPSSYVLEFGAGWSSLWFAERCRRLVSVESSEEWAHKVNVALTETYHVARCSVRMMDDPRPLEVEADLVLVDSEEHLRYLHAIAGWRLLKGGGWLVFDDAQRVRHAESIALLKRYGGACMHLGWNADFDIPEAKERVALAWQK